MEVQIEIGKSKLVEKKSFLRSRCLHRSKQVRNNKENLKNIFSLK